METEQRFAILFSRIRRLTLIEWLVLIATLAVVISLLLPPVKWASSGFLEIPVRVKVVNAIDGQPIADARVAIVYAPPLVPDDMPSKVRERLEDDIFECVLPERSGKTGDDGIVLINHEFNTGANYKLPTPHAHLFGAWVMVAVEGYGGVLVPVRHYSQPTKSLREQTELPVSIGLLPSNNH